MREAKVDEGVFAAQVAVGEGMTVVVEQREGAADAGGAGAFGERGDAGALEARLLVAEVEEERAAREQEEESRAPGEGL